MPNSKPSAASARPTGVFGPSFLRHRTTEVLGSRQFRRVLVSNLCFFLAMGGQGIVRPWLAFQLTDSPFALGLVSAAVAFPMFVLAPFGGVLADRMERRKLILLAQTVAMLSELTVLVLLLTESLEFWHLLVTAGLMGCAFPLIMPARQAIVMNIVGKAGLGSAMALNMAGVNVTRVVGPAAAGVLIPLIRVEGVYMVNLTLYLLAVTLMTRVAPVPPAASARGASMFGSLTEGIRYVGSNRLILVLLVFGLVPMFLAMPFQTLLVVFAEDVWETGSTGLGILNAAAGIGAVVGSIFVASRGAHEGRLKPMMLSVICFGVLLAVFSACPWFLPAVGLIFVANVFVSTFGTLNNTAIQLLIPDQVRGRISAFLMMSFSLPMLGTLPVAAAADRFGAPLAVAAASLLAVLAALGFYAGSPKLRQLDEHVAQAMSQV
jgi:MFS family permease